MVLSEEVMVLVLSAEALQMELPETGVNTE
jgi:hypothetical protein